MIKKLALIFLLFFLPFVVYGQNDSIVSQISDSIAMINEPIIIEQNNDSLLLRLTELADRIERIEFLDNRSNKYKLYPTGNVYNFLLLNTQTGQIDQVQWHSKEENEFSVRLNTEDLSWVKDCNSFELYPTEEIHHFILLDKATGRRWHVQWGPNSSKCWIRRIY